MSDAQLVKRAARGDQMAFAELFDKHKGFVWNLTYRMTYNQDAAEDISQEVFVSAWRLLPRFKGSAAFST